MADYLNYLIEANLCLLILGLVYFLLFRKETDIRFRRYFILGSIIITLVAPLFHFNQLQWFGTEVTQMTTIMLPELNIGQAKEQALNLNTFSMTNYLFYGYWLMVIVIAQLFLFQLMQVGWFVFSKKTNIKKQKGTFIIYTNGTLPTFSFLNILFFDNSVKLSSEEKAKIIYHEMVHIGQRHSVDIILLEIAKIILWFNPVAWFYRKEIQDIHEYLADDKVIKHTGSQQYSSLLAKMALTQAHLAIGHHFNKSKTLKRIEMMKQAKQKVKRWKTLLMVPIVALLLFVVSCNDEVMQEVDHVMETASQTEMPSELEEVVAKLEEKYPDAEFAYFETDGTSSESLSKLNDLDPKTIAHISIYKERNRIGVIVNRKGPLEKFNKQDDVFQIVEEPAMPYGGYGAFYERIMQRLKYPLQARKMGIEGKVYVQFIVDKEGNLTDLQVVKGIGAGCDKAAVEALAQENAWSPPRQRGKAVKQRIILPITFHLDDNDTIPANESKPAEVIEIDNSGK